MSPLLLVLIAVILYAGGWTLFLTKIDGLRNEFLLFRITDREHLMRGMQSTLPAMLGIMALGAFFVVMLNVKAEKNGLNRFSPPEGFQSIAQIDLSQQAYMSEALAQFTLDEPDYVGVFVVVHNIDTTYFDLSLTGPDGFSSIVLHGEGYNAFQDGGLWEQNLPAGTYQLMLNSQQSPGTISVYLKIH